MFEHGFPKHWSTLKKFVWLIGSGIIGGASAVWKTVTGTLIHITNALASPMQKCEVTLEPIQSGSGDPSPTNVRPITGWTGCEVTRTGKNLYSREESLYNLPVYATDGTSASYPDVAVWWIKAKPNTKYTVSGKPSTATYYIRCIDCDENKGLIYRHGMVTYANIPLTVTTHTNTGWLQIAVNQYPTDQISKNDWQVQVKEGDSAEQDEYEPYSGTTLSVTFPDTVYGGSHEFVSGGLKSKMAKIVYDGSSDESWTRNAVNEFYIPLHSMVKSNNYYGKIVCDKLKTYKVASSDIPNYGITGYPDAGYPNQNWLYVYLTGNETVEELRSFLSENPITVVYELATPTEISLTPQEISTLKGENNVWGSGDIELTYKAQA